MYKKQHVDKTERFSFAREFVRVRDTLLFLVFLFCSRPPSASDEW